MSEHIYEDSDMEHERYHVIPFGSMREEIVRCRDCRYYATDELGDYCTLMDFENVKGMADRFCAWGERKSDE